MRIIVDRDACQGHARCQDCCPEVFSTDAIEGKCVLLMTEVPPHLQDKARKAVRNCPEGALSIARGDR